MFGLVARLKGDTFGLIGEKPTREEADELKENILRLPPEARLTFAQSPGFGIGMPFPAGAIAEMLVLEQGVEEVPDSWYAPHADKAAKFADALHEKG
jgi:hypothetical protein